MYQETVDVFVPDAGAGGSQECTVVTRVSEPGTKVRTGEVLARMRCGQVDLGVQAPVGGTLLTLYARDGARMRVGDLLAEIAPAAADPRAARQARPRSPSSAALVKHAPLAAAAAISAAALAWPVTVLVASMLAGVAVAAWRDAHLQGGLSGSADVVVAPLRLLRSAGRIAVKGLSIPAIIRGLCRLIPWIALAVLIPAAVGCLAWLVSEGTNGLLAAMRMAAYGYALGIFAFVASFWILRRALAHDAVASRLRAIAERLPEAALSAAAVAGLAWIVVCAALIPRSDWAPAPNFESVVQALPGALRDDVNDLRVSIVRAQAGEVVACMRGKGLAGWHSPRAFVDRGTLLVGVRPGPAHPPDRRSFAILVLALHNQLAPSRVSIAVVPRPGADPVSFDTVPAKRPVTDVGGILARATTGSSAALLPAASDVRVSDVEVALSCSAAAV